MGSLPYIKGALISHQDQLLWKSNSILTSGISSHKTQIFQASLKQTLAAHCLQSEYLSKHPIWKVNIMKPSNIIYPVLALAGTTTAGPIGLAGATIGCLGICTTALATCHATGHGLSVFTFGFTSFVALATCHQIFLGCEAQCMSSTIVPALASPL
jgi:hypothetical protein